MRLPRPSLSGILHSGTPINSVLNSNFSSVYKTRQIHAASLDFSCERRKSLHSALCKFYSLPFVLIFPLAPSLRHPRTIKIRLLEYKDCTLVSNPSVTQETYLRLQVTRCFYSYAGGSSFLECWYLLIKLKVRVPNVRKYFTHRCEKLKSHPQSTFLSKCKRLCCISVSNKM
jgi:hypothetical protein